MSWWLWIPEMVVGGILGLGLIYWLISWFRKK